MLGPFLSSKFLPFRLARFPDVTLLPSYLIDRPDVGYSIARLQDFETLFHSATVGSVNVAVRYVSRACMKLGWTLIFLETL